MKKGTLGPLGILSVVRELRPRAGDTRPLAVAGARELVPLLARELRAGGDPGAVVEGTADGAAALVWLGPADVEVLRAASRAGTPIVAVTAEASVPYVFTSAVVHVPAGQGLPVDEIARALARGLGDGGTSLAARLPVLREAVCQNLIASFAKKNAIIAAAVFIPGVDLPALTLNQLRLVSRIANVYDEQADNRRAVELLAVVWAGFGLRAIARQLLEVVPVAGWAVKGGIAYTGTRAVGEAAVRYFEARESS